MANMMLYGATVLIWGSTWLAITFQLGTVAAEVSVAYRFALAAGILFLWCGVRKLPMRFSRTDHLFMLAQGAFLFSFNYMLFYLAEEHITSGLAAVIFSLVIVMNIANNWIFRGQRPDGRTVIGAIIGLMGICAVFAEELAAFDLASGTTLGMILALAATIVASFGNIVSARNQRVGVPVMQANAFGMAYGAALQGIYAVLMGSEFTFDPSFAYVSSLIYLAIFGSIIAFWCYLTLLGRIGPDKAAYAAVLFPIVALVLSTFFEGFVWTDEVILGIALILLGNVLVLAPASWFSAFRARRA
jgi:drug/metabolite transporter (DMT)-like permease